MLRNPWAVLALLFFARFSMGVFFQSIPPIIPDLIQALSIGYTEIGVLIGIAMFAGIGLAVPGGLLSSRLGDKRVMLLGLAAMTAGEALFAFASTYSGAFVARLLAGVGMALLNVQLTKLVTDWFPPERLGTAMGVFVPAWPLGIAASMTALGFVSAAIGWRAAVGLTACLSGALLLITWLLYHDHPGVARAAKETARRPLWNLSRLELGLILLAGLTWGLLNVGVTMLGGFAPALLVTMGMTTAVATMAVGICNGLTIISIPAGGALADRLGATNPSIALGLFLSAAVLATLGWSALPWLWLVLLALSGGLWAGPVMTLPGRALTPGGRATGFGVFYTVFYGCLAGLVPVGGWLIDRTGDFNMPMYYGAGMMLLAVVPFGAFLWLERRTSPAPHPAPEAA